MTYDKYVSVEKKHIDLISPVAITKLSKTQMDQTGCWQEPLLSDSIRPFAPNWESCEELSPGPTEENPLRNITVHSLFLDHSSGLTQVFIVSPKEEFLDPMTNDKWFLQSTQISQGFTDIHSLHLFLAFMILDRYCTYRASKNNFCHDRCSI